MRDLYHKIWDPSGVPYEVVPERASDLVLNRGWSNTAPVKEPKTKSSKKTSKVTEDDTVPAADTVEAEQEAYKPSEDSE